MMHNHQSGKNWIKITAPIAAKPVHFTSALRG